MLLSAIWIGINDVCFNIDPKSAVKSLFTKAVSALYASGARHFCFFNNPPRMPISASKRTDQAIEAAQKHQAKIDEWNVALDAQIKDFKVWYAGVTVFKVDAHALFQDVFEHPEKYGFTEADVTKSGSGKMWMDGWV